MSASTNPLFTAPSLNSAEPSLMCRPASFTSSTTSSESTSAGALTLSVMPSLLEVPRVARVAQAQVALQQQVVTLSPPKETAVDPRMDASF